MKIDNKTRAGKIKLFFMLGPFIIIAGTAIVFLTSEIKSFAWLGIPLAAFVLFFVVMFYFRFNYVSVYAGPDKIWVRYKSLSPFISPNNSVKISAADFHHYEIAFKLFGRKKLLHLFQQSPGGVAKYPSIGISAMTADQIQQMQKAFDLLLTLKKKSK